MTAYERPLHSGGTAGLRVLSTVNFPLHSQLEACVSLTMQFPSPSRSAHHFPSRGYRVRAISAARARAFLPAGESRGAFRLAAGLFGPSPAGRDGRPVLVGVVTFRGSVDNSSLTTSFPWLIPFEQSAELGAPVLAPEVSAEVAEWFVVQALRVAAGRGVIALVGSSAVRDRPGPAAASGPSPLRRVVRPWDSGLGAAA